MERKYKPNTEERTGNTDTQFKGDTMGKKAEGGRCRQRNRKQEDDERQSKTRTDSQCSKET